jgi:hypothetical protein
MNGDLLLVESSISVRINETETGGVIGGKLEDDKPNAVRHS